ncbi:MAG: hypothetical protein QM611_02850 [Microbacterium sp.]|uniref:hypothetical protein n=1 Tax=Microbacterium sp. TaxID=51671 RepID=UPI0039E6FC85
MAPNPPAEAAVEVTVTRTGGVAGLRRQWRVEPGADDAPRWVALIEDCPWDELPSASPPGADLFVWQVWARCVADDGERVERDAELPDPRVQGPWLELIAAVRAAASSA